MGYSFLNACIAGTMTKIIVNLLTGRFLEVFSETKGVSPTIEYTRWNCAIEQSHKNLKKLRKNGFS